MAFMRIETMEGVWYIVEVKGESHYVAPDLVNLPIEIGEMVNEINEYWLHDLQMYITPSLTLDNVKSIEARQAWGARYSTSGTYDCTDWVLGETEEEVIAECKEMYGDEE